MDCERAQETLWPLDAPGEHGEGGLEARRHLRRCDACRAFFRRDARLAGLLERVSGRGRAPPKLRERILEALARERAVPTDGVGAEPGRRARRRRTGPAAAGAGSARATPGGAPRETGPPVSWLRVAVAVLALGAGSVVAGLRGASEPGPASLFARDFAHHTMSLNLAGGPGSLRHATPEQHIYTSAPDAVARFVRPWTGDSPVRVGLSRGELVGAMICWLQGRPAAVVMYRVAGHPVYHYRYRPEGGIPEPEGATAPEEAAVAGEGPLSAVHVVRWNRSGEAHALVSDLSTSELRRLAGTAVDGPEGGRS